VEFILIRIFYQIKQQIMYKLLLGQQAIWNNAIVLLRIWVGVIFVYHGVSIFHPNSMQSFAAQLETENIPFPLLSAWLCKASEFFGGIFLIVGFLKRPACFLLIIDMAIATFVAGNGELLQNGRTPFILLICCLIIFLSSSDKLSIDWLLFRKQIKTRTFMVTVFLSFFLSSCAQTTHSNAPGLNATKSDTTKIKVGNAPGSVEVADFNHDNYPDLAIASETDSSVTILLGDGKGGFTQTGNSPFFAGSMPNDICIADINKDRNLDLAFANHERKYLTVLLGDGKGNFIQAKFSPLPTEGIPHVHGIATGDFNNDGWLDLVTDSWGNDQVEVLFGDNTTSFAVQRKFFKVGKRPYQRLRAADLNGDSITDIVTTNTEGDNVSVLLADGKGGFNEAVGSPFPCGDDPFGIAIGDVNADGIPDLAIINSPSSMAEGNGKDGLTVLLNDGAGKFTMLNGSTFQAGQNPNRIAIGDVNGDRLNEIVTSDYEGNKIYLFSMDNAHNLTGKAIATGRHPKGVAIVDLNGDGKGDIVVCNNAANNISIIWGK
jgi:uncharacterized membrane protein YphA (DoxX/SURF4 family)